MASKIQKSEPWPETKITGQVTKHDSGRWPESPTADDNNSDIYHYDRSDANNDYNNNAEWGHRGEAWNQGFKGGHGNGYGQQERGARAQHGGYYGGDYQSSDKNNIEGYSDSDTRVSPRKSERKVKTNEAADKSKLNQPASSRSGTRSASSRNRSRSPANRGKH